MGGRLAPLEVCRVHDGPRIMVHMGVRLHIAVGGLDELPLCAHWNPLRHWGGRFWSGGNATPRRCT
jgi:hypothetical protein